MESPLSETLLLIPESSLIIELVQAVYLHIPILLCQQQCLHLEFYFCFSQVSFLVNSTIPVDQVQ